MGDQAERVILEAEDEVTPVVNRANAGLDSFEKKAESSHGRVVRITDQTRSSIQRLIASLEKQAETYGKSGVDRLIAQRDSLLQRYAKEPQAIDAITKAYERMIATQQKTDSEELIRKQSDSLKALGDRVTQSIENPIQGAGSAVGSLLTKLGPLGVGLSAGAAAMVAIGVAGFEAAKSLGAYGIQIKDVELRTGLSAREVGQFGFAAKAVGQDVSIFERMMRGLAQAADDTSKEGEKARATMQKMGITMYDTAGAMKPTSQILEDVSVGLAKMPNALERDAAAMALFKRVGVEGIPVITELSDNLQIARERGYGPSEEEVHRFAGYARDVAELETSWGRLKRNVQEPLVIGVNFVFNGLKWASFIASMPGKALAQQLFGGKPTAMDTEMGETGGYGYGASESRSGHAAELRSIALNDRLVAQARVSDQSSKQVQMAEDKLRDLQGQLKTGVFPSVNEPVLKQIEHQRAVVANLKESEERAKSFAEALKAVSREWDELQNKAEEKLLSGGRKLVEQGTSVYAVDIAGGLEKNEMSPAMQSAAALSTTMQMMAWKSPEQQGQEIADMWARQKTEDEQHLAAMNRQVGLEEKLLKYDHDGADLIDQTYNLRLSYALQEYDLNLKYTDHETATVKLLEEADKLRITRAEQLAELQHKQAEDQQKMLDDQEKAISKVADKLIDTLITKPKNFAKEFATTVREAVLKPAAASISGMAASVLHPVIYGSDGQGGVAGIFKGILGGSGKGGDPVKVSTDENTTATRENSRILATLTAAVAMAAHIPVPSLAATTGAGGGITIPSISAPASTGPSIFIGGGGAAAGGVSAPNIGDVMNLPMVQHGLSIPESFGLGGSGTAGAGAPFSVEQMAGLPMTQHGISPEQLFGLAAGGKLTGSAGMGSAMLSNLKGSAFNQKEFQSLQASGSGGFVSGLGAVTKSPAVGAAGMMAAESGLLGSHMGSWEGVGMGAAGGAALGFQMGGPLGALIGAVAGAGIGIGEKLAGIESPQVKAHNDIKQIYGVDIPQNSGTIKQVVSIAQSQFGGDIAVAVRSPNVRQLVMLYSEATGQKMPLSASTPYAGSLVEQGGNLYQQASFQNNAWHSYASDLPTLGGIGGTTLPPTPGPNTTAGSGTYVSLNINGQPITADFVADQSMAAQNASYGRTQQSANLQVPGLMVA